MEGRSIPGPAAIAREGFVRSAIGAGAVALILAVAFVAGARAGIPIPTLLGYFAAALPALALSGFLAARRPVWSVFGVFLFMAFAGALAANVGVQTRAFVWLLLLGLLAATVTGYLNSGRTSSLVVWPGIAALGAYLALSALQVPFAETSEIGARAFAAGPALIVGFFALAYARWDSRTRWRVAQAFALVALFAGAYALLRLFTGPTGAEQDVIRKSADVGGELSLFGSFPSRLELGAWSAVAVPFLFSVAFAARGRWRWLSAAAAALMLVALLGTEVRTALIGAGLGVAVAAALLQATRSLRGEAPVALLALVGLVVAGMIGFGLTVGSDRESTERFERILTPGQDYSFQARLEKWDVALAEINDHPLGEGLGTAGTTQRRYSRVYRLDNKYIDNSYLQLGVQQGYPGWILLAMALGLIGFTLCRSSLATADRRLAAIGVGAAASLVTWLVTLLTGDMLTAWAALLVWMLLGLAAGGFVAAGPRRVTRRGARPRDS